MFTTRAPNVEQMTAERNVKGLIKTLSNTNPDLCAAAVKALGQIGDGRAVEPLIGVLEDHGRDARARDSATAALSKIGAPAVGRLITELNSLEYAACVCAARALGEIGDPRAVEALAAARDKVIFDPDAKERPGHHPPVLTGLHKAATKALVNIVGAPAAEHIAERTVRAPAAEHGGVVPAQSRAANRKGDRVSGMGSDCPYYSVGRCMAGGRDSGPCSWETRTYRTCSVYQTCASGDISHLYPSGTRISRLG
jgi:hypothetical protein